MPHIELQHLAKDSRWFGWAVTGIQTGHYLGRMPDPRTSAELFLIQCGDPVGALVFGRPEATRCADWYGSVEDVAAGRCEVTRWQVLNLSRVWIHTDYNCGGRLASPGRVPGFWDRTDMWRSTLASEAIKSAMAVIGWWYLCLRPPCFLDEPYEIRWLLSYCDTRLHRGTIYRAAGFELYRTNDRGIQTWRTRLPGLEPEHHEDIRAIAETNPRSIYYRAKRTQLALEV